MLRFNADNTLNHYEHDDWDGEETWYAYQCNTSIGGDASVLRGGWCQDYRGEWWAETLEWKVETTDGVDSLTLRDGYGEAKHYLAADAGLVPPSGAQDPCADEPKPTCVVESRL